MGDKDVTAEVLMDEIHAAFGIEEIHDDEWTLHMYAERFGIDDGTAKAEMQNAIKKGAVIKLDTSRKFNGKRVLHVYRKAE